jgi:hypothetical protein
VVKAQVDPVAIELPGTGPNRVWTRTDAALAEQVRPWLTGAGHQPPEETKAAGSSGSSYAEQLYQQRQRSGDRAGKSVETHPSLR